MLSLKATIRTELGKKSKKLRKEGFIPGILYGKKSDSIPVSLLYKEFEKVYNDIGESALVSLRVEQGTDDVKENVVLIRDAVRHPLTRMFIHADFYQVPMDEKITISVPLTFENEAPAVKNEGAVLARNLYEIEISAFPKDLPTEVKVDLSSLEHIEDSILIKSLSVASGVEIGAEENLVVASVSAPVEEEIIDEEVTEEVAPEDIKTEAEEKREEEEKEEAGEAAI